MESMATGRYIPQKSKKRVFPGSSSCMGSKRMNKMSNRNEDRKVMISSRTNGAEEHHTRNKIHSSMEGQSHKEKGKGVVSSALGLIEVDSDSDSDDSVADSCIKKNYMDLFAGDYIYDDDDEYAILQSHFDNIDLPTGIEASLPGFFDSIKTKSEIPSIEPDRGKQPLLSSRTSRGKKPLEAIDSEVNEVVGVPENGEIVRMEDVKKDHDNGGAGSSSRKEHNFKKFDIVKDHKDHHFAKISSRMEPPRNWAKTIQEEWRILKKNLPDTIFVRVYESRMDLLTAVIIGAEGTPYHDGLFFFDICFPSNYPHSPPLVYYHSGGLNINPNLYANGKVCLSLLNTWAGSKNEKWIPGSSTMLQVLVSIQGLILNEKPYFNEPGYASSSGSVYGERLSVDYNERMLVLSLKTMVYTMKKPPQHFEDLVIEHFRGCARAILMACKAYSEGVRVGCAIDKGKVEGCSRRFKGDVVQCMKMLVGEFKQIGVEDVEKLLEEVGIEGLMASTSLTQKIRGFFGF